MFDQLPRTGTGIMLRDGAEAVYPSRIESWDQQRITVVKPMGVPAAFPYALGSSFDVLWTSPTGLHVVRAELTATRSEGPVRLWVLTPVDEPWVEQRRAFVRVPVFGRVRLAAAPPPPASVTVASDEASDEAYDDTPDVGDPAYDDSAAHDDTPTGAPVADAEPRTGYLLDVSEAALQCSIVASVEDPLLVPDAQVVVDFTAHGTDFARRGWIHGARPGADENDVTVIVRFDQTANEATELRKAVFAVQVDLRRIFQRPLE